MHSINSEQRFDFFYGMGLHGVVSVALFNIRIDKVTYGGSMCCPRKLCDGGNGINVDPLAVQPCLEYLG